MEIISTATHKNKSLIINNLQIYFRLYFHFHQTIFAFNKEEKMKNNVRR